MKNAIRVLTIVAAAIMGVSVLALWGCVVYREPLTTALLGEFSAREVAGEPVLPVGILVYALGLLGSMVALCFTAGNSRVSFWVDVLLAALIGMVLPAVKGALGLVQRTMCGSLGVHMLTALSAMESLWGLALVFSGVALALALVACGMSIAVKRFQKSAV